MNKENITELLQLLYDVVKFQTKSFTLIECLKFLYVSTFIRSVEFVVDSCFTINGLLLGWMWLS
ncbi:hypothetical protein EVA_02788 [gut metagenome]|uniref:Uncharacterized protein n=1 Tax=gut metagenome TaxID=749906 RepID=J9D8I1_9ZZZZ